MWVSSLDDLLDFFSMVIVHAPDDFPKEDYLPDDAQLTLDSAFEELKNGMQFVAIKFKDDEFIQDLEKLLNLSLSEYRQGNDVKGAHLLQNLEAKLRQRLI